MKKIKIIIKNKFDLVLQVKPVEDKGGESFLRFPAWSEVLRHHRGVYNNMRTKCFFFFPELQMCAGAPGPQLHATSHWRCSRTGGDGAGESMLERRSGAEERRKMYVKIMCLQDALYKAIKLSASETSHGGRDRCLWQEEKSILVSCLFHRELWR